MIQFIQGGEIVRNSLEVAKYIEKLLEKIDMKPSELANRIGVDRSTVTRYFKGDRKISMDEIPKIASVIGVTPDELLFDKEDSEEDDDEYFEHLGLYGEIFCGEGEVHFGHPIDIIETPYEWVRGAEHFYLEARGDSMVGAKVYEGDLLLIRKQDVVENGEIAAVVIGDKRMLKRVYRTNGSFTLVSENPKYPPVEYRPNVDEHIRILGKLKKSITSY